MSVRTLQRTDGATFYCTFTCWNWLPLIERTNAYDHIYRWMHIAQAKGARIFGRAHSRKVSASGPCATKA